MVVSASGSGWVYTYTRLEAVLEEEVAAALGIVAPVEQVDSTCLALSRPGACFVKEQDSV
jgi:hypothetical protein